MLEIDPDLNDLITKTIFKIDSFFLNDPINKDESIGLLTGLSGYGLLMAQKYLETGEDVYLDKLSGLLEAITSKIEGQDKVGVTLADGLAGFGLFYLYLVECELVDALDAEELLIVLDDIFINTIPFMLKHSEIDLLNGALGVGIYLVKRGKESPVNMLISHLEETQDKNADETKWFSRDNSPQMLPVYDFGLAHGQAGIIYFLKICYQKGYFKDRCQLLINGVTRFLCTNFQDSKIVGSYFPSQIYRDDYNNGTATPSFSRIAWCYGDLTIFYILYDISIEFKDYNLEEFSLNGLLACAKRTSKQDTLVNDAGFCHGSCGIAYIYQKLYKKTGLQAFSDAGIFWIRETLLYGNDQPGIEGYKFLTGNFEDRLYRPHKPLLEGSAGVELVLLSFLNPELPDMWDTCLMLN